MAWKGKENNAALNGRIKKPGRMGGTYEEEGLER